ncbi:MAG: hypothetical protein EHM23_14695 [Acidobacteria bacterium]|nr:MAG: hypothetical protein EHM23_14695 [Acidobacteriota bacterium]
MTDQSAAAANPIGIIHSPFTEAQGTPIQPAYAVGTQFEAELFPQYVDGLKDLAGFERVWLIYWFHRAPAARLLVTPFRRLVGVTAFQRIESAKLSCFCWAKLWNEN